MKVGDRVRIVNPHRAGERGIVRVIDDVRWRRRLALLLEIDGAYSPAWFEPSELAPLSAVDWLAELAGRTTP